MPNGMMTAPPPVMQPRVRLFGKHRRKDSMDEPPAPPPGTPEGKHGRGRMRCDECYVAEATYEVTVDMSLKQYLYFCTHHMRKRWSDLVSRHYHIRKL